MVTINGHLESALQYATLGYPVFPCANGGKVPITRNGYKDATTDGNRIKEWWTKHPYANIGIPTAGLLVIDVDGDGNPWPGNDDYAASLNDVPISHTPHGGRHYIFSQPNNKVWRSTASRLAPQVDTRANGGYIVVPTSVVDGKPYEWLRELPAEPDLLPEPPTWLVDALDDIDGESTLNSFQDGNSIPAGQRNSTLASLAGNMRRVGMGSAEIAAAMKQVNLGRCDPPLPDSEVERIVDSICKYEPDQLAVAMVEHHYAQDFGEDDEQEGAEERQQDPGQLPVELLGVPGFVSEVMDYCLETAPYPNPVMAFCGALALQAFLAGRKVRDPGDNRTNIYLLGLAHSAAGKDWPRKINTRIAHRIGLAGNIGDSFASGEGIQDALFQNPCMLFQTDEIDGILQSINKAKDARYESILSTLLSMYSSANSVYPMRRKAGKDSPGSIEQPCLIIFGTAIPNHYYEALSERMLTNGFFARTLTLESGPRAKGQEPRLRDLPERVLETTQWWASFPSGKGDLENLHPKPVIVEQSDEAMDLLVQTRKEAEAEYAAAEDRGDPVGTTVWGRVSEHIRKLGLLYAVSENYQNPCIDLAATQWATRFILHQTRRMLYMAKCHVADNPFHANCLKFQQKLREAPNWELPHSILLKRMKIDAQAFQKIVQTTAQQGDIEIVEFKTPGRTKTIYRLKQGKEGGERIEMHDREEVDGRREVKDGE